MKCIFSILLATLLGLASAAASEAHAAAPEADSPLTAQERQLTFSTAFLKNEAGKGSLLVHGEPLSVGRILSLSPWDLMELVQTLSGTLIPLSRFGNGDELTQAWRSKVATFAAGADAHHAAQQEDLFEPALVLWDPGYIQNLNEWGQWTIQIGRRMIVQGDLPSLSPLEVQQAVEVLTGRIYTAEFVLEHLEAFRAQLSVVPRLAEAAGETSPAHH